MDKNKKTGLMFCIRVMDVYGGHFQQYFSPMLWLSLGNYKEFTGKTPGNM